MWTQLSPDALLKRVTAPERTALNRAAIDADQVDVLQDICKTIIAEWRGGLARVCALDKRRDYLPDEIMIHALADFRYRAFTRLPGMESLLDSLRVAEWERANRVRDALGKIQIAPPEEGYEDLDGGGVPLPWMQTPKTWTVQ